MGPSAFAAIGVEVTVLFLKEYRIFSSITYAFQAVSEQGMAGYKDGRVRVRTHQQSHLSHSEEQALLWKIRTYSNIWVDISLGE